MVRPGEVSLVARGGVPQFTPGVANGNGPVGGLEHGKVIAGIARRNHSPGASGKMLCQEQQSGIFSGTRRDQIEIACSGINGTKRQTALRKYLQKPLHRPLIRHSEARLAGV